MLRTYRVKLEKAGIDVLRVITLGALHFGTELSNHPFTKSIFGKNLIDRSITPNSAFRRQLNRYPSKYMKNIKWYFIAGVSFHPLALFAQETLFNGVPVMVLLIVKVL